MLQGIFDSHAHYDDHRYDEDRDAVFSKIRKNGVWRVINIGCDMESSQNSIAFAEQFDFFYAAVGIHPENAEEATSQNLARLKQMLSHQKGSGARRDRAGLPLGRAAAGHTKGRF